MLLSFWFAVKAVLAPPTGNGVVKRFLRVQKEESSREQAAPVEGVVMSRLQPAGADTCLTPWKRTLPFRGTFSLGNSLGGQETISPYFESKILEPVAKRLPS